MALYHGNGALAIEPWQLRLGNRTLSIKPWQSTLAIEPWQSNLDNQTLAIELWHEALGIFGVLSLSLHCCTIKWGLGPSRFS